MGSEMRGVTPLQYAHERDCWFDGQGYFTSLLVISNAGEGLVPHFVSMKCYVDQNGDDATPNHLNDIGILDKDGVLFSRLGGKMPILSNTITDTKINIEKAKLYKFFGKISLVDINGVENNSVYEIKEISILENIDMDYSSFIEMNLAEKRAFIVKL